MAIANTSINAISLRLKKEFERSFAANLDYLTILISRFAEGRADRKTVIEKLGFTRRDLGDKFTANVSAGEAAFGVRRDGTTYRGAGSPVPPAGVAEGSLRFPQSPPMEFPGVSSRLSRYSISHNVVPTVRWDMFKLGFDQGEMDVQMAKKIGEAAARERTFLTAQALVTANYRTPIVLQRPGGRTQTELVPFPIGQNWMPPVKNISTGSDKDIHLTVGDLQMFLNRLSNSCGLSVSGRIGREAEDSILNISKVLVFSNSGWSTFLNDNEDRLSSRLFGDDIFVEGLGKVKTFGDAIVLTVPDESLPLSPRITPIGATEQDVSCAFQTVAHLDGGTLGINNYPLDGLIAATAYTNANRLAASNPDHNKVWNSGLYTALCIHPRAVDFHYENTFAIDPVKFKNPNHALEEAFYTSVSLAHKRLFDPGVHRLFFGRRGAKVTTGIVTT